jgi:hypothetical protein
VAHYVGDFTITQHLSTKPRQGHPLSIQKSRTFFKDGENQFTENGVGPSEPGASEFLRVVLVERLVHETRAGVSFFAEWSGIGEFPRRWLPSDLR